MYLEKLTSKEISKVAGDKVFIWNIGSLEQHGPSLPLGTDSIIGKKIFEILEEKKSEDIIIVPQLPLGYSGHHMEFSGTISLKNTTLMYIIEDVIESIHRHGATKIIIVNSHGGNSHAIGAACQELSCKYKNLNLFSTSWWSLCRDELSELNTTGYMGIGHAGEFETSLMMEITGKKYKEFGDYKINHRLKEEEGDLLRSPKVVNTRSYRDLTSNGIYGTPISASAEKGKELLGVIERGFLELIENVKNMED